MTQHPASQLPGALQAWGTPHFARALQQALEALSPAELPLARACHAGGLIEDGCVSVSVVSTWACQETIDARVGLFFNEQVGGCSCGEEPFSQPVYCQLQVRIDRQTAHASFELIDTVST